MFSLRAIEIIKCIYKSICIHILQHTHREIDKPTHINMFKIMYRVFFLFLHEWSSIKHESKKNYLPSTLSLSHTHTHTLSLFLSLSLSLTLSLSFSFSLSLYIYIYHHPHVVPPARISLTISRHFSLSFIASGRSSGLHPVSSHSCCI